MYGNHESKLDRKKKYLQVALNSTLDEARKIIFQLPKSDRILVEAGTPLIKRYGEQGIRSIVNWYQSHLLGVGSLQSAQTYKPFGMPSLISFLIEQAQKMPTPPARSQMKSTTTASTSIKEPIRPYVVADLKMMDRGSTEVEIAARAGASAAVALGAAPLESLNSFIESCAKYHMDSMIDMMNIDFPLRIVHQLRVKPTVVILHRGVDEEQFNKEKQLPLHEIRRVKSQYDIMISVAGGDTVREAQRAIFNDADIVVVWKSFYQNAKDTGELARQFLEEVE